MRSKLFVPGARIDLFAKALAGDADALSFDLEDSVPDNGKRDARDNVARFLSGDGLRDAGKLVVVRINALESEWFDDDVAMIALPGVAMINLPKVESTDAIAAVASALDRAEKDNGVSRPIGLLATIESPRGLRNAAAIACAHPRVAGLQMGFADLFEPLGIDRSDVVSRHATLYALRLAAGEAGIPAWDAAYPQIDDAEGFRDEAALARRLGFVGKSCVHPRQVTLANAIFAPDAVMIEQARRIVDAARNAAVLGHGAFRVDGRMVDLPYLKQAEALLASVSRPPCNDR